MRDAQFLLFFFFFFCLPSFRNFFILFLAGPYLPAVDHNGSRPTSSANSWSQWISPDLHCQLSIVDRNGLQWAAMGCNGLQWAAMGFPGPQPTRIWTLWASPDLKFKWLGASLDLNHRDSEYCGPRRTSIGPQHSETKSYRTSKRMPENIPNRI